MILTLRLVAVGVLLLGSVLLIGGIPGSGSTDWPIEVAAVGGVLMGAALAAGVALHASVTWSKQRIRDVQSEVWRHRARVYEEVFAASIGSFTGRQSVDIAADRAKIALWASDDVIEAFRNWHQLAAEVSASNEGATSEEDRERIYPALFAAISAARADLSPNSSATTQDNVMGMIFNDYGEKTRRG